MDNYYLKSLVEDNEMVFENKSMKSIFSPKETILFSNKIIKIRKNVEEDRIIVITDLFLYNLKKKKYNNKVDIRNITGITISKKSEEFVVHNCEIEDDFHYKSEKRNFILEILARVFYTQTRRKMDLSVVDKVQLDEFVTQKSDKKSNKGKTKFDPHFCMDIDHYLYGNLEKKTSKILASVTQYLRSEIVFYNPEKCKLDPKKLRIENFRQLEVLSLSVYGDVILGQYNPTGEIYFIRTINSSDTNEFCLSFDLLLDINTSNNFPFIGY